MSNPTQERLVKSEAEGDQALRNTPTIDAAELADRPTAKDVPVLRDYRVLHELGKGGQGKIWASESVKLNRKVALKQILHCTVADRARLEREMNALADLTDVQNVLTILDVVESENGDTYLVLEYVEQGSLGCFLREEKATQYLGIPISERDAAVLILSLSRTMEEVHARKIIHRDLKPSNILLAGKRGGDGPFLGFHPKIADFGLAKPPGAGNLTKLGAPIGTRDYYSPEQAQGEGNEPDVRMDIYGLGAILFFCLTGEAPGQPLRTGFVSSLEDKLASVHPALKQICMKCLKVDKKDRPQSAIDLAHHLAVYLGKSNAPRISPARKVVRIAMLRSGDLDYTRDIRCGFEERLRKDRERLLPRTIEIVDRFGPSSPGKPIVWKKTIEAMHSRAPSGAFDYYVGVGTNASRALRNYFDKKKCFGKVPFLFLAVTDPVNEGLVGSLENRPDDIQVAGIGFPGANEVFNYIYAKLFKGALPYTFEFVYWKDHSLDESSAERLRHLLSNHPDLAKVLSVRKTAEYPERRFLEGATKIYWSRYTFEMMFEEPRGIGMLTDLRIIANSRCPVRDALAVAAVSADMYDIGQKGAEMLLADVSHPNGLGKHKIDDKPTLRHWINLQLAQKLDIHFSQEVLDDAEALYGVD